MFYWPERPPSGVGSKSGTSREINPKQPSGTEKAARGVGGCLSGQAKPASQPKIPRKMLHSSKKVSKEHHAQTHDLPIHVVPINPLHHGFLPSYSAFAFGWHQSIPLFLFFSPFLFHFKYLRPRMLPSFSLHINHPLQFLDTSQSYPSLASIRFTDAVASHRASVVFNIAF